MVSAGLIGSAVAAQEPVTTQWDLTGAHGGYCIRYLADSTALHKLIPKNVAVASAGSGAGLSGLVARTVQDEPRFASWIPASFCIHFYDRVSRGGKTIAEGKPGRPIVIATNAVAVRDAEGVGGATAYLIDLMTDNGAVVKAGQDLGLDPDKISVTTRAGSETGDSDVTIDASGVVMDWSGHPSGDPGVAKTHSMSFGYAGSRALRWVIRLDEAPATTRFMVGTLQINGKNALATAMKGSPVRDIGPEESGGTATITFHVATKH